MEQLLQVFRPKIEKLAIKHGHDLWHIVTIDEEDNRIQDILLRDYIDLFPRNGPSIADIPDSRLREYMTTYPRVDGRRDYFEETITTTNETPLFISDIEGLEHFKLEKDSKKRNGYGIRSIMLRLQKFKTSLKSISLDEVDAITPSFASFFVLELLHVKFSNAFDYVTVINDIFSNTSLQWLSLKCDDEIDTSQWNAENSNIKNLFLNFGTYSKDVQSLLQFANKMGKLERIEVFAPFTLVNVRETIWTTSKGNKVIIVFMHVSQQ